MPRERRLDDPGPAALEPISREPPCSEAITGPYHDRDGAPIDGDRPSKTLALHRRIYASDRAAMCVIHSHSTHLVSLAREELEPKGALGRVRVWDVATGQQILQRPW